MDWRQTKTSCWQGHSLKPGLWGHCDPSQVGSRNVPNALHKQFFTWSNISWWNWHSGPGVWVSHAEGLSQEPPFGKSWRFYLCWLKIVLFFPDRHGEGIVTAMCDTGLSQSTSAGCKLLVKSGAGSKFCFCCWWSLEVSGVLWVSSKPSWTQREVHFRAALICITQILQECRAVTSGKKSCFVSAESL